ncbi:MAG: PKD domain-containing protein [Gammaproteobacteria bacterium]|nr:PKD domain-containing protein [Gammaproteobacteria bacterium]
MMALRRGDELHPSLDLNHDSQINSRDSRVMRQLCSYQRCSDVTPPLTPPTVTITAPEVVKIAEIVQFSATVTTNPLDNYGHIISYQWDFSDGTTSNEVNPTHQFSEYGFYRVTLTVTDNHNQSSSTTVDMMVSYPDPLG